MPEARATLIVEAKDQASSVLAGIGGKAKAAGGETKAGFDDALQSLTGFNVGALAGVGAITAVGGALAYAVKQAADAEKIMAQTEAVIKSTGGAAGMTADEVARLATSLSNQSVYADDAIQAGENLLLTFTNIGKDVFPDATKAMVDMAAAMGTDVKGGAIQLGKALNDPVKGVTALTRVGVTFTEEQKKMIKALQETGNTAGAQQIILAELNKEFGGSAAAQLDTYSGKMAHLQNTLDNLAESIGGAVIPVLSGAADGLMNWMKLWGAVDIAIMQSTGVISDNEAALRAEALAAGDLTAVFTDMPDPLGEMSDANDRAAATTVTLTAEQMALNAQTAALNTTWQGYSQVVADGATTTETMAAAADAMQAAAAHEQEVTDKLAFSMGELNKQTMFAVASQGLSADAQFLLAEKMGLVNEGAAAEYEHLQNLKAAYDVNKDGLIDLAEAAAGYADAANSIALAAIFAHDELVAMTQAANNATGGINGQVGGATGDGYDDPSTPTDAAGGNVYAGMPAIVGDGGRPELFVPDSDGYIYPVLPSGNSSNTGNMDAFIGELRLMIMNLPRSIRDALVK